MIFFHLTINIFVSDGDSSSIWAQNYLSSIGEPSSYFSQNMKQISWLQTSNQESKEAENFKCRACGNVYKYKRSLLRHLRLECGKEPQFSCPLCYHKFTRATSLRRHIKGCHHKIRSDSKDYTSSMLKNVTNHL